MSNWKLYVAQVTYVTDADPTLVLEAAAMDDCASAERQEESVLSPMVI